MLAQANASVKDRQSCRGRGEFGNGKGEGGVEKIVEGRSILTASFPMFTHELSFSSARGTGCCLR